ncbi:pectinesterase family protein [Viridibacterium curvum]|uniref:Pectinesterase catalytic domain-containing protein n=1 Tax=Viridibacterium curvum TaxID=1101404 RepID=A0ABP9QX55_9RHOO
MLLSLHRSFLIALLCLPVSAALATTQLAGRVEPALAEQAAQVDVRLKLRFDATPAIGTAGFIKVFRARDNKLVDSIDMAGSAASGDTQTAMARANTEVDALAAGVNWGGGARYVYFRPVVVRGETATITLHNNRLEPDTEYYVTLDAGVLSGKIAGGDFAGVTREDGWRFKTRAAHKRSSVTVDDDGEADFRSIQGALNHIMSLSESDDAKVPKHINVRNGVYEELLFLRGTRNLTVQGESRDGVVVHYDNYESFNPGTGTSDGSAGSGFLPGCTPASKAKCGRVYLKGGRAVWLIEGSDLLTLRSFTLKNSHVKVSKVGEATIDNQAEAIYFNSEGRLLAREMNFISAQDTILVKGWSWFHRSLVAGDVDFIWGYPRASLFEDCEIRSVKNVTNNTGYVLQARAVGNTPGFVFLNSRMTAEEGVPEGSVYLARSGGQSCGSQNCDNIAFVNTQIGVHIAAAGWLDKPLPSPRPATCSDTLCAGWVEFGSKKLDGSPLDITQRFDQAIQMPAETQAKRYATRAQVFRDFGGGEGWNPQP